MLKFEDVKSCGCLADLNRFIRQYLDERGLHGEDRRKTYWALFYAWKDSLKGVGKD